MTNDWRYTLMVVGRDGSPADMGHFRSLRFALEVRDFYRDVGDRQVEHWAVYDAEDQERGYLDHEDLDD